MKKKLSVGIIDLERNNIFSIYHACKLCGYSPVIIKKNDTNYNYDFIILPGVGAFKGAIDFIKKNNIDKKLKNFLKNYKSGFIYGICLGMQLMFEKSFEMGKNQGLGFIKGSVKELPKKKNFSSLNIGWKKVDLKINKKKNFYFVHSFFCEPIEKKIIVGNSRFGKKFFCAVLKTDKIIATQFHPEKSGIDGLNFLKKIPSIMKKNKYAI